jgi:GTPase SAR1 family protein
MKTVVVLGSAGAGKSTLIRDLTASNLPVVSHRKFRDGTETITTIPASYDDALYFIDTPGLDSATFPTKVSEHIQNQFRDSTVLAALVVSKTIPRITSYINKFEAVLEDLFGNCNMAHFLFLWTNCSCDLSEEDREDAKERFPNAVFHEVGEISALKELIDGSTFCPLRVRVSVPRQTAQRVVPSQTRPTVNPPKVLMCVKSLGMLERFEKVKPDRDLREVIKRTMRSSTKT